MMMMMMMMDLTRGAAVSLADARSIFNASSTWSYVSQTLQNRPLPRY
jgi:hypothetical protein